LSGKRTVLTELGATTAAAVLIPSLDPSVKISTWCENSERSIVLDHTQLS